MLLTCLITIVNASASKKIVMQEIEGVTIKKGWANLVNRATVTMSKNVVFKNNVKLTEVISVGSKINIELGYDGKNKLEFQGYISKIMQTIPIVLECEDDMYLLKKITLKPKTYDNATLLEIVKYITQGFNYKLNVPDVELGKFMIEGSNATPALVLQYIKDTYGFSASFIRVGELTVGFPYQIEPSGNTFKLDFGTNIVSHDLVFKTKEDTKIILKGSSHTKGKKPLKIDYNPQNAIESEAETRTIHCQSNLTESQILAQLKIDYQKILIDGYAGSVLCFGTPFIETGGAVVLQDSDFGDRKGKYLTRNQDVSFGNGGFRRKIEITRKL
jgi:hypothetical protein